MDITKKIRFSKKDFSAEENILTGMIVSTSFLRQILPLYNPVLMELPYAKIVGTWCSDYYNQYEKAPYQHIQDIFNSWKRNNPDEDYTELLGTFLYNLSQKLEKDVTLNEEYLLDQAENFFKHKSLQALSEDIKAYLTKNLVTDAEALVARFNPLKRTESGGINPLLNKEAIKSAFEADAEPLIEFPGALGKMINDQFLRDSFVAFLAGEKKGKCIVRSNSNKVLLDDGRYVGIEDLFYLRCTNIVSYNVSEDTFEKDTITDFWENGVKPVYKVTTKSGRNVEATLNHPLLTPEGWSELKDLKEGDFIGSPKYVPFFGDNRMEDYKIKLLAYLIADGDTRKTGVVFTKGEKAIQEDFVRCVESMGCQATSLKKGIDYLVVPSKENKWKHDKNFVRDMLKDHGILNKHSYDKFVPKEIFTLCKEDIALFLNTLYTCDGSAYETIFEYCSTSEELAKDVHHLLTRFGIVSKIRFAENKCGGAWTVKIGSYEYMKKFMDEIGFSFSKQDRALEILDNMSKKSKSFLDRIPNKVAHTFIDKIERHYERLSVDPRKVFGNKWKTLINQISRGTPIMRQSFKALEEGNKYIEKLINTNILWEEIVSIEYVGEKETVDLTIKNNHNFITQDIIVHNSQWLLELAIRSIKFKRNVAFFAVGDMTEKQMIRRAGIYITRKHYMDRFCGPHLIPVFDCLWNQYDICTKKQRRSKSGIMVDNTRRMKFEEAPGDYIPCIYCKDFCPKEFAGSTWFKQIDIQKLSANDVIIAGDRFFSQAKGKDFKLKAYPNKSVNFRDLRNQLDMWEHYDNFVPDIVILDYIDNMGPENGKMEFRHQINETWQAARALSQERNILFITATQADRKSYTKKNVGMENASEDKRKNAHVTAMFGLNQLREDKEIGIMRVSQILAREAESDELHQVAVLQDYQISRAHLGSYTLTDPETIQTKIKDSE